MVPRRKNAARRSVMAGPGVNGPELRAANGHLIDD